MAPPIIPQRRDRSPQSDPGPGPVTKRHHSTQNFQFATPPQESQPQRQLPNTPTRSPSNETPESSRRSLHIDATYRAMGHYNHITFPSSAQRAEDIERVIRAASPMSQPRSNANTGNGGNATENQQQEYDDVRIDAGLNITGTRNVITFSNARAGGASSTQPPAQQQQQEQRQNEEAIRIKRETSDK